MEILTATSAAQQPSSWSGRPRLDDYAVLNGILFVLTTGIPWEDLPQSLGFGSGMTCWHRLAALSHCHGCVEYLSIR
ncbi:hypothetical protein B6E78_10325 [Edwardsiella ictaluri]|nr:hypothetical protein B6E78_10325 [Edwardsiella ictaluri]